ncbi:MAG: methionyl-tRNA formyltransferase [Solirubrobacterales bacterium]|nr:methionyl-tRNA formyltransferase [Solirubrobacterales bacterium]
MRTVFLGTSEFAAAVLERLAGSAHRPELVVTRPDRPAGRGRRLTAPPVARSARALGIELFQPPSVNDAVTRARIAAADPDVVCVCAFGALIREPLLSEQTMLNVHPSLLPRWRGAAPIERAIMAGDPETGVSILRLASALDSGPVCAQEREPIEAADTYGTLAARLQELGAALLLRALDGRPLCREQDESQATYAEKISASDRFLDPSKSAATLERIVRALTPHVGARLELADGTALGVRAAAVVGDGPPPGELSLRGRRPVLGCAGGALELLAVHPPGRQPMSGEEYLRGLRSRG